MNKWLTITVPAYNAEEFLDRCLTSFILNHEEQMEHLQILVVNDGSTDRTEEIAQEYVKRYPAVFTLINKENGGHGSGINTGIRLSEGIYFKVVDADDWVDTNALEILLQLIGSWDAHARADVIATDFLSVQDETYQPIKLWQAAPFASAYGRTLHLRKGEVTECIKMHHMTIRTAILKQMGMKIDEHHFYVDMEYITYPIPFIDSVYYLQQPLYRYRLGRAGQTMDSAVMKRNRSRHRFVMERLLEYFGKWEAKLSQEQKEYMALCISKMVESHFQIYLSMEYSGQVRRELKEWDQGLKKNYPLVYRSTHKKSITLLRYTDYLLLPVGMKLYQWLRG